MKYEGKGLLIMGFPSDSFGNEPGTNKEIQD